MLSQNQLVGLRRAIETTYCGKCTVTEKQKVTKEDHSTGFEDAVVCENEPCRVSFESVTASNQTDSVNALAQTIKLFLSPDIAVKPGSRITVEQDNLLATYESTGIPAVHPTHQEIYLQADKERA